MNDDRTVSLRKTFGPDGIANSFDVKSEDFLMVIRHEIMEDMLTIQAYAKYLRQDRTLTNITLWESSLTNQKTIILGYVVGIVETCTVNM